MVLIPDGHHETSVFWPRLSLSYGDARGCKICENITIVLSRNAQPQHIHSLSGASTDMMQSRRNIYGYLWFPTVSCDRLQKKRFLNMLKITPWNTNKMAVDPGTSQSCLWTWDGYPMECMDNPGLKP